MKLFKPPYVAYEYSHKSIIIPLTLDSEINDENWAKEGEVDIEIKKHRSQRSKDANAYYFSILRKIAEKMCLPLQIVHNQSLANCGIAWEDSEGHKTWVLKPDGEEWKKETTIHLCPTDRTKVGTDGVIYRYYYLLLPSHLMNTKQMSILVDSVIEDARSLGIEV